ncbi:alpha/beta fold hydrolase [Streptomyces sp. NPDC096046]|uniref:alpha/beta hydrolase n=1 Tax=Streptomyces sp. NPDC096046 TaxID=3155542 RepID=UPI00331F9FF4
MSSRVISAFAAEEAQRVLSLKPVLAPVHGRYGDHPHQSYDAWPSDDPDAPLVILLHGGYWRYDRMHLTPFAAYLSEQGFCVLLPGFRRSGGAGGYPATFDDVARIVDTLPEGRPYVLAGHCSGGHLALWCAARGLLPAGSRWHTPTLPTSVLALAPITDLTAATTSATAQRCNSSAVTSTSPSGCPRSTPHPAARRRHHRRPDRVAARRRRRGGPAHPVRRLRGRAPGPQDGRPARHRPLIEPGAPGARAVADTLRDMAAAFTPGDSGHAREEAAHP